MWSKNINEIVSTHGYSLNQIIVWRYPSMSKVATLTGHTYRCCTWPCRPTGRPLSGRRGAALLERVPRPEEQERVALGNEPHVSVLP